MRRGGDGSGGHRRLVVLAVFLGVLVLGACQPTVPRRPPPPREPTAAELAASVQPAATPIPSTVTYTGTAGPRVAFVGDSIANFTPAQPTLPSATDGEIQSRLGPGFRHSIFAWPDAGLHDMRGYVAHTAATRPDVYVIELGTASLSFYGLAPLDDWAAEVLNSTANVPCVLFMTIKEHGVNPHYDPNWASLAGQFNTWLRGQDAARPNMRVLDWSARAAANPSWFLADGLHLNQAGVDGFADLIGDGTEACMTSGTSAGPAAAATSAQSPTTIPPPTTTVPADPDTDADQETGLTDDAVTAPFPPTSADDLRALALEAPPTALTGLTDTEGPAGCGQRDVDLTVGSGLTDRELVAALAGAWQEHGLNPRCGATATIVADGDTAPVAELVFRGPDSEHAEPVAEILLRGEVLASFPMVTTTE